MTTQHRVVAPTSKLQMAGAVLTDEALVTDTPSRI